MCLRRRWLPGAAIERFAGGDARRKYGEQQCDGEHAPLKNRHDPPPCLHFTSHLTGIIRCCAWSLFWQCITATSGGGARGPQGLAHATRGGLICQRPTWIWYHCHNKSITQTIDDNRRGVKTHAWCDLTSHTGARGPPIRSRTYAG